MKNLVFFLIIIAFGLVAFNQPAGGKKMTITTASDSAKMFYKDAITALENADMTKFLNLANSAYKEDPDFFMANYYLAITSLNFRNETKFLQYARNAVNCEYELSKGELLLKDAIGKLMENRKADVTGIGKQLVKIYPKDVNAYYQLYFFQALINDFKGEVATLKSAIEIAKRPAPLYNWLGYTYMSLGQNLEAAAAFDKYIELDPNLPNPYDSKGDYYMSLKEYSKAYASYLKAHELDSLWSYKKALRAKAIADSISGNK